MIDGSSSASASNVHISDSTVRGTLYARGGGSYISGTGIAVVFSESIFTSCSATGGGGTAAVGGAVYVDGNGVFVTCTDSVINNCSAFDGDGGALWVGVTAAVELEAVQINFCTARRGAACFLASGAWLATAYVTVAIINCTSNSNSAFHLEADVANTPLRGLRINAEGQCAAVSASAFFSGTRPSTTLRCADERFAARDGSSQTVCGPGATCSDEPIVHGNSGTSVLAPLTSASCSCTPPAYALPGSFALLSPFSALEGCVTAPHALAVEVVAGSLLERFTRGIQISSEVIVRHVTMRMTGTDRRREVRATYSSLPTTCERQSAIVSSWVTVSQPYGAVNTSTLSSWTWDIEVVMNTSGLKEDVSPYTCELGFQILAPGDLTLSRTLPISVSLFVTAVTTSIAWGELPSGDGCVGGGPLAGRTLSVLVGLVTRTDATFQACDSTNLPVSHALPSLSDSRVFRAYLVREGDRSPENSQAGTGQLLTPLNNGLYAVSLLAECIGTFQLRVELDGVPMGVSLRVTARCPTDKVTLGNGQCGCRAGEFLVDGECTSCPDRLSSAVGATSCDICAAGYLRTPQDAIPSRSSCVECPVGAECPRNASLATLRIKRGYWRLDGSTVDIHDCRDHAATSACPATNETNTSATEGSLSCAVGDLWNRCTGGDLIGTDGDSYCAENYGGPRCQVCLHNSSTSRKHFNAKVGRCVDCPQAGDYTVYTCLAIAVAFALLGGCSKMTTRLPRTSRKIALFAIRMSATLQSVAPVPKLKLMIGLLQFVNTFDKVYEVEMPEQFHDWMESFQFINVDWASVVIPGSCLGQDFSTRLLIEGLVPFVGIGTVALVVCMVQITGMWRRQEPSALSLGTRKGLVQMLPLALFLVFCFCVSTSYSIFGAWRCQSFTKDAVGAERKFLRGDLSVECGTSEHSSTAAVGYLLFALWPVGMPLLFLLLLIQCHDAIKKRVATSRLIHATAFLYSEYKPEYYYWEVVFLGERLTVSCFVQFIDNGTIRLLFALVVTILYLAALLASRPFKRADLNILASLGVQIPVAFMLLGGSYIHLFQGFIVARSHNYAQTLLGFKSEVQIASLVVAVIVSSLAVFSLLSVIQGLSYRRSPIIRLQSTKQPPELGLHAGKHYHLFLSHVWSTGQDQCAAMKRSLQLILPGVSIFLDVDDLEDVSKLERYVTSAQCVLFFLSKGYFASKNCLREIRASVDTKLPLVLVHERERAKGGLPLEELKSECPEEVLR